MDNFESRLSNLDLNRGWQNQDVVYIVMYRSRKSGGTYTEIRRTAQGLARLLQTLKYLGYKDDEIIITEQKKKWMPDWRRTKTDNPVLLPKKRGRKPKNANANANASAKEEQVVTDNKVVPFVANR